MTRTRYRSVEMTTLEDADEGVLTGYASIYENPYPVGDGIDEVIHRGAFTDSLRARNSTVPVFYQHGWAKNSNSAPIGYATIREDDKGLRIDEARLFVNTDQTAQSVFLAAKAGALREWSVGFVAEKIRKRTGVEGVERGDILEISVVVKGANKTEMTSAREADTDEDVEVIDETVTYTLEGEGQDDSGQPEIVERAYGLLGNSGFRKFLATQINAQPDTKE